MEAVPKNCQKGVILKLPKESNMMEYTNWCGITLLSVKRKAFFTMLLCQLKGTADQRLCEEQAGFRHGRSCTDQIFTLRNIIEQLAFNDMC